MTRFIPIFLLAFAAGAAAQTEPSIVYLKNGQKLEGEVAGSDATKLQWKVPGAAAGSRTIPYSDIIWVDFPDSAAWREALTLFYSNQYQEAAEKLTAISISRGKDSFYPAPGNFSTLADRRLLDCYRRLILPAEIPNVQQRIEWDKLPPDERDAQVVIDLWGAIGSSEWDRALEIAGQLDKELAPGHAALAEVAYLRGRALEAKGQKGDAVFAYADIIGPFPGANRLLAKDALKRSAAMLDGDAERGAELKALVHIYAKSFGNGQLWTEASAAMKALLNEPIEIDKS